MSIQEHLNKIRNAVYGREVRESIAKGIETAYDDASIEKDNANMEVKMARAEYPTLNDRLNAFRLGLSNNNNDVSALNYRLDDFNERVDKIIATPTSVSEQEIIDARLGKTSLGESMNDIKKYASVTSSVFLINNGQKPSYNISANIFTFHSDARLICDDVHFEITAGTEVLNEQTYNAVKLLFNVETETFRFEKYWGRASESERLVATIRDNGDNSHASANFDIDLIGVSQDRNTMIDILLGENNSYPMIDTDKKTITFPKSYYDTIFIHQGKLYPDTIPAGKEFVIDYGSELATSAFIILWEVGTSNFETHGLVDGERRLRSTDGYALFATMRSHGGDGFVLPTPYIKDGIGYGTPTGVSNTSSGSVVDNPLDANIKAIAHRGYNKDVPENTLSAMKVAKKMGFNYVETDVRRTKDGVPVLLHDETIDRTSNGTGAIADLTYEEVKELDFGSWKNEEYAGEKIPTFEEFIILCKKLNLHPYIEALTTIEDLHDIVKKHGMIDRVTWIGGIGGIKAIDPKARLGVIRNSLTQAQIDDALTYKTGENEVFLNIHDVALDREMVSEANRQGLKVECWIWGGSESTVIDAINKGASGITVDNHNVAEIIQNSLY